MKILKWILLLISILFFIACGSNNNSCETGYHWDSSSGECIKDISEITDKDNVIIDKSNNDIDTNQEADVILEEEQPDKDQYLGDCMFVAPNGTLKINIETSVTSLSYFKHR